MQAMILAAGFGTRLLPYTTLRPKPLFPLLNQPLLLLTIQRLQQAGFDHIVVNCHYLKEQIIDALQGTPGVEVQVEEQVLGTGGGLGMAAERFRDEPVLVTNGDIYHTIDFRKLYDAHGASGADVTLAMHDYPRFNNVAVDDDRIVGFGGQDAPNLLAFTGLHVLSPALLLPLSGTTQSCIIDYYRQLLAQQKQLRAHRVDHCFWTDMGTKEDYLSLHGGLLTGTIAAWPDLQASVKSSFYIDRKTSLPPETSLQEWCCVGRSEIGAKVRLSRAVVWDGAHIEDGAVIQDAIVTPLPL